MADQPRSAGEAADSSEPVPGAELPALFANRFYVVAGPRITRIAFGEFVDKGTIHYRSAVSMPMDDAKQLVEVLSDVIRRVESQIAADQPSKSA